MQIKKAVFRISGTDVKKLPADMPEIAIAGKSNVGKSSFINCCCNNFKLAYVGATPGKTRLINYFTINDSFYLVDLPGYGYAKVSKQEQMSWSRMMENYLHGSKQLRHMIFLVDIRHDPTALDQQMMEWLRAMRIPYTVVATKCDKIPKRDWKKRAIDIAFVLKLDFADDIIPFSAKDRAGKDRVLQAIGRVLEEAVTTEE